MLIVPTPSPSNVGGGEKRTASFARTRPGFSTADALRGAQHILQIPILKDEEEQARLARGQIQQMGIQNYPVEQSD